MERDKLICFLSGEFIALQPSMSGEDLKIKIDQRLTECNLPSLGSEPNDDELIKNLLDETIISLFGQGINRKMRRRK